MSSYAPFTKVRHLLTFDRAFWWGGQIRGQKLHHYTGTYSKFLRTRDAQQQQALQDYQAKQAEIERLEGFVNRFGAKATKAAAANSKKKQIERIKQQMPDSVPVSLTGT